MTLGFIDPPHLRHLGEFASLKHAVLGHFDADSSLRYRSDAQRWAAMVKHHDAAQRALIAAELRALVGRDDAFVIAFWDRYSDYHYFETADGLRAYLFEKAALLD